MKFGFVFDETWFCYYIPKGSNADLSNYVSIINLDEERCDGDDFAVVEAMQEFCKQVHHSSTVEFLLEAAFQAGMEFARREGE